MSATAEQRHRALDRANEIRLARAKLKAKIHSGEIFAASVLLEVPPESANWPVGDLLTCQRRWGSKRMGRMLARCQIPQNRPVGALTERQRRVLVGQLEGSGQREAVRA